MQKKIKFTFVQMLIQKDFRGGPTGVPRCGIRMEIIAFIEGWTVIGQILRHLNLREWLHQAPPPPFTPLRKKQIPIGSRKAHGFIHLYRIRYARRKCLGYD